MVVETQKNTTLYLVLTTLIDAIIQEKPTKATPNRKLFDFLNVSSDEVTKIRYKSVAEIPVLLLLEKLKPPPLVVDFVALRYLKIFQRSNQGWKLLANSDALSAALQAVYFGSSKGVKEKIVREVAKNGWHRAEGAAQKLLGRNLNKQEVFWLVNSYVKDRGSQSSSSEHELMRMAHEYLTLEEAREVERLILEFRQEWDRTLD
jgi:hypothetical protein